MATIIAIEGTDGSGKQTQTKMLSDYLRSKEVDCVIKSFPQYNYPSASMVIQYLNGSIKEDPMLVNPYAASMCYALDRYITFEKGRIPDKDIIIFDRYVTSNIIHQSIKLPEDEREAFAEFMYDFEYNKLGLPKPDVEIFLDMPAKKNMDLIAERNEKIDIHENLTYQQKCHDGFDLLKDSKVLSDLFIINCMDSDGSLRTKEDIHQYIRSILYASKIIN